MTTIDQLIINSPYSEPSEYWSYDRETRTFDRKAGRRPAGYVQATPGTRSFDDPGIFKELPLVNQIRPRVKAWRQNGYPGVTGVTKRLLEHWRDPEERQYRRFFFCQLEAIETLIWMTEAPYAEKQGLDLSGDGGPFERLCSKMATGSGKTIVMAMLIAWQVLNKSILPQDARFAKHILVVAPGLTVKSRLGVLQPSALGNYYDEFNIVPSSLRERLRQGKVHIINWHKLNWESEEQVAKKKTVDKRGALSDEAYVRSVLDDLASAKNILVINDEAHHAWRVPAESKIAGVTKDQIEEATKWVGGLDRIHRTRGILRCYDFSATPFAPSGKQSTEEALFSWIVSDFGLNDAIESGLVKTPRIVIRDDAALTKDYKSRLYHIYTDDTVRDDLARRAQETDPLPDLVTNAYYLLGKDWLEMANAWKEQGYETPPVMITVANRTETAARIKYSFDHKRIRIDELCDPERTLHIDSKVLDQAESREEALALNGDDSDDDDSGVEKKMTKAELSEYLRQQVDTVGQKDKPGEKIQNVISVGMLSEGWDAKTVTHIMGLRAFSSQLLCEQVVGRGLRRTSYDVNPETGLFEAEYVNIFGVPFSFLPHEGGEDAPPKPENPPTRIEAMPEKSEYEISWPNIIRIDHVYVPELTLDMERVKPIVIDASKTIFLAEVAAVVEGKPNLNVCTDIELATLGQRYRLQSMIFEGTRGVYEQMEKTWKGSKQVLLGQLFKIVEAFTRSDRIRFEPARFRESDLHRRVLLAMNINKIVHHIWEEIRFENTATLVPVFDPERPIRSTGDMMAWYTRKPNELTKKSHISHCVFDSTWEATEAFVLDRDPNVAAWAKNDHLGFEVLYVFDGIVHKFRPDFLIRLTNGTLFVLEVKGQDMLKDRSKRKFMKEWISAVNEHGGFGKWSFDVSFSPRDIEGLLDEQNR